jgi:trehalose/maltose hydrolase-like predicted phosphorylase
MAIKEQCFLESDDTGEGANLPRDFEQHITADVSIAFWNYYAYTQDKSWLKKEWNVLKETAFLGK